MTLLVFFTTSAPARIVPTQFSIHTHRLRCRRSRTVADVGVKGTDLPQLRYGHIDLHQEDVPQRLLMNCFLHFAEHGKGFSLILNQWIPLRNRHQTDALAQNIEIGQMLLPVLVNGAQHDDAFRFRHHPGFMLIQKRSLGLIDLMPYFNQIFGGLTRWQIGQTLFCHLRRNREDR